MSQRLFLGWGAVWVAVLLAIALLPDATGFPQYYEAWLARYPASTLPNRMFEQTGSVCHTCHHPPNRFDPGTCYREDLIVQLNQGNDVEIALANLDGMDSDGDGTPNGVEILMARSDLPGEIGYHPGLSGPLGVDPCGANPTQAVSNQLETPPAPPACPGDLNGDRRVDQSDLGTLLAHFGQTVPPGTSGDLDGDGDVDQSDLGTLLGNWGRTCQ